MFYLGMKMVNFLPSCFAATAIAIPAIKLDWNTLKFSHLGSIDDPEI